MAHRLQYSARQPQPNDSSFHDCYDYHLQDQQSGGAFVGEPRRLQSSASNGSFHQSGSNSQQFNSLTHAPHNSPYTIDTYYQSATPPETLSDIARQYNVHPQELLRLNPNIATTTTPLPPGYRVALPDGPVMTRGQTGQRATTPVNSAIGHSPQYVEQMVYQYERKIQELECALQMERAANRNGSPNRGFMSPVSMMSGVAPPNSPASPLNVHRTNSQAFASYNSPSVLPGNGSMVAPPNTPVGWRGSPVNYNTPQSSGNYQSSPMGFRQQSYYSPQAPPNTPMMMGMQQHNHGSFLDQIRAEMSQNYRQY